MKEPDLEPLAALVLALDDARRGQVWDSKEPDWHPATREDLLEILSLLYWRGRDVYDQLAARLDGAKSYAQMFEGAPKAQDEASAPRASAERDMHGKTPF